MKSKVNFREGQETNCLIWLKGSLFFYFWDLEFCQSATHPTLPAVSTWTSPPLLWFTGPTSAHLPPLDPLECSTSLLQPTTCWILTDGAPRSSMENTHHLLQLLSLTTIFEFDGFSKYIPRLTCRRGGTNQVADVATESCCEQQILNNQLLFKRKVKPEWRRAVRKYYSWSSIRSK